MLGKPVIGITLDSEDIGGYSNWYPWYAIRKNYAEAVTKAGGIPILLPHEPSLANHYFSMLDGLIVSGGDFDVHPYLYGQKKKHPSIKTKPERTVFEKKLAEMFIEKKKPILGICGGEQLINVILGGTLIQHIPDKIKNSVHQQKIDRKKPQHSVKIKKGTIFYKIIGSEEMKVNSTHHQAVDKLGKDVVVNAVAKDKIIEGIEYPEHPFCLGVQWHPEYAADPKKKDSKIFAALIEAAQNA